MTNYDQKDQQSIATFVLSNLSRHKQFTLATVDPNGHPWCVCLNLTLDNQINFIWKSQAAAEHSKHVRANPTAAICVFSESEAVGDFGFYAKATAHEVQNPAELSRLLDIRYKAKGKMAPALEAFLEASTDRIYYAEVKQAWVNDDRHIKTEIDLVTLRNNS